jgi:rhodanese-related sulfurtransferase
MAEAQARAPRSYGPLPFRRTSDLRAVSYWSLNFRASKWPAFLSRMWDVILHCASGGRAALAGKLFKDIGYERVYNLGGFKDWVEAGGKVEK